MAATRRREREMVAVAFNQKEQRVLEKSLNTLRLEQDYSLKLLDLHNRTVKVHFRQLKDRVSRIKSYLSPEEISKLRQLETEGKLRPMYPPVCLGNAMKIAAAARRLNSSYGRRSAPTGRSKSALPRVTLPDGRPRAQSNLEPPSANLRRSNSITGVFIDAPASRGGQRPGSASEIVGRTTPAPEVRVTSTSGSRVAGPKSAAVVNGKVSGAKQVGDSKQDKQDASLLRVDGLAKRLNSGRSRSPGGQTQQQQNQHLHHQQELSNSSSSSMDSGYSKRQDSANSKRPTSKTSLGGQLGSGNMRAGVADRLPVHPHRGSASTAHSRGHQSHARAPFSSHVVTEKEAREQAEEEQQQNMEGGHSTNGIPTPRSPHHHGLDRYTSLSLNDDAVDSALGEDLYEERRQELLEEEQYRAASINRKKDAFLREVDKYLREHPPLAAQLEARSLALSQKNSPQEEENAEDPAEALGATLFRRRRPKVEFDSTPTYLPEEDYRERLMGLWRDMNKCRYLRVPEELIDLSGINTLASDTMKLFQIIKNQPVEPLSNAWKE